MCCGWAKSALQNREHTAPNRACVHNVLARAVRWSFGGETEGPLRFYFKGRRKMIIEIRAAEGGDDAKLLVVDQFRIYTKLAERRGL